MKTLTKAIVPVALALLAGTGCAARPAPTGTSGTLTIPAGEIQNILDLVNDPEVDVAFLDIEVALNSRAAGNIIAYRNGPDGTYTSTDDNIFGSLEELDAISYVGDHALQVLWDYVVANPPPSPELVEGVQLTGEEAVAVVWGVNRATVSELDDDVGLDVRAAGNLVASAPYGSVGEMGPIAYVGASALGKLRAYAPVWQAAMEGEVSYGGTFDGVHFDDATALTALEIANQATLSALVYEGGIWSTGAGTIVANRPYADLGELAGTHGVGPGTMRQLHDLAASGAWPFTGGCEMSVAPTTVTAVTGYDQGLLENDYCAPWPRYSVAAWDAGCVDTDNTFHVEALQDLLIEHSGWTSWANEFPQMFEYGPVTSGPAVFQGTLSYSLNWLGEEVGTGGAAYVELEALHAEIVALTNANPASSHSFLIHIEASEASEDAVLFVDESTGLILTLHKGWGC